jgi:hypothetical protein
MQYSREIQEMLAARVETLLDRAPLGETPEAREERRRWLTEAVEREFAAGVQRRLTTRG